MESRKDPDAIVLILLVLAMICLGEVRSVLPGRDFWTQSFELSGPEIPRSLVLTLIQVK